MIEAGQNDPRISKNRTRKTLSDWGSVRKPLLFGFPTPRDLPYAYILGVSLLRASVSAETFDDFLAEQGLLGACEDHAIKEIIAEQLVAAMKEQEERYGGAHED
jgi:hypothetical protein